MSKLAVSHKLSTVALVEIIVLAAVFRLYHLSVPAFGADTMNFFDMCHRPVSARIVFTQWMDLLGRTTQFAVSLAIAKCLIDVQRLPLDRLYNGFPSVWFFKQIVSDQI